MICPIRMKDQRDVARVSKVACESGLDMKVHCGSIMIDPRSILALFTLLGKGAVLVAPDSVNPGDFAKIVKKMGVSA